ncbi:MAG TPA: hypothetical protein VG652_04650 [Gaiellaceae bacterium]|nr:hypothetical protein [Gaiellaceae bacterium]
MSDLIGKSVLVEITCFGETGAQIDAFQVYGRIETVDERWIGIKRADWSEPFGLPPAPELFEPAPAGAYTLRTTGEQIEDLDLLVSMDVNVRDAESLLTLRGVGLVLAPA